MDCAATAQTGTEADAAAIRLNDCELYPLAIGTRWTYRSGPLVFQERVVRHEHVENETCARIDTIFEDRVIAYEHLAVRPDGVYRVSVSGRPVKPPLKFLNLPAKPGERWTIDSQVSGQTIRGEFLASEESFALRSSQGDKDRSYQTHRVAGEKFQVSGSSITFSYDFVPRMGKVKQVVTTGGQQTVLELFEFTAAGDLPGRTAGRDNVLVR